MKTSQKKLDDNKIEVTFEHNDVTVTRVIDSALTDKGKIDKYTNSVRIEELANSIEAKINLGLITNEILEMQKNIS